MTARNDGPAGPGVPGDELLDVVVVGGSQAGLAIAWHLAREGLRFVVLEAGPEIGHTWRSRWDSLTLFTPAQYDALPGMAFPGPPDTYPGKDAVAGYLEAYAAAFDLPVRLNSPVTRLSQTDEGFKIHTQREVFNARQVVVAAGPFQQPFTPPAAQQLDASVTQLHSAEYRNPRALPPGRCWSSAAATPGSRSPKSSPQQAVMSTCRSPPRCRYCPSGWRARTCSGGSPGWGYCGSPPAPGRAAGCPAATSSSAAAAAGSGRPGSGSGPQWPARTGAPSGSPTAPAWTPEVVIWATGYRPDYSWIGIPGVTRDGQVSPPPRCHRCPRPVLPGPVLAAHPRLGPARLRPRRRRLPRRPYRRPSPNR